MLCYVVMVRVLEGECQVERVRLIYRGGGGGVIPVDILPSDNPHL